MRAACGSSRRLVALDPVGEMERISRNPAVQDASKQYSDCVIGRAVQMAQVSAEPAETIARAALGGCALLRQQYLAVVARELDTVMTPERAAEEEEETDWRARRPNHRRPRRCGRSTLSDAVRRRDRLRRNGGNRISKAHSPVWFGPVLLCLASARFASQIARSMVSSDLPSSVTSISCRGLPQARSEDHRNCHQTGGLAFAGPHYLNGVLDRLD